MFLTDWVLCTKDRVSTQTYTTNKLYIYNWQSNLHNQQSIIVKYMYRINDRICLQMTK